MHTGHTLRRTAHGLWDTYFFIYKGRFVWPVFDSGSSSKSHGISPTSSIIGTVVLLSVHSSHPVPPQLSGKNPGKPEPPLERKNPSEPYHRRCPCVGPKQFPLSGRVRTHPRSTDTGHIPLYVCGLQALEALEEHSPPISLSCVPFYLVPFPSA